MSTPANGTPDPTPAKPALDRLEELVNSELFADVVFSVGTSGTPMFGHKAILTAASNVFRAQFSGNFRESTESGHEIAVIDIEPAVFKEILRYAYCDRATVTGDNVLQVWYAANKYLFGELAKICTEFLERHLSEENVLQIFGQNRRYELEDVNRKCLDAICANPIRVFADEHFLTLDSKSLELIAESERMNCRLDHLLRAIESWLKINEHDAERGNEILGKVLERKKVDHMCKTIYNFSSGFYKQNIDCKFSIKPKSPIFIHGIGIPIKMKASSDEEKSVRVDISIWTEPTHQEILKSITVPVTESIHFEEVMFERQLVTSENVLYIQVQIGNEDWPLFAMHNFTSDQPEVGIEINDQNGKGNCISYVLYTEVTKSGDLKTDLAIKRKGDEKDEKPDFFHYMDVRPPSEPANLPVHTNISCDICGERTIRGHRYKCLQCFNYDLCMHCEANFSHKDHLVVRIPTPEQGQRSACRLFEAAADLRGFASSQW